MCWGTLKLKSWNGNTSSNSTCAVAEVCLAHAAAPSCGDHQQADLGLHDIILRARPCGDHSCRVGRRLGQHLRSVQQTCCLQAGGALWPCYTAFSLVWSSTVAGMPWCLGSPDPLQRVQN